MKSNLDCLCDNPLASNSIPPQGGKVNTQFYILSEIFHLFFVIDKFKNILVVTNCLTAWRQIN